MSQTFSEKFEFGGFTFDTKESVLRRADLIVPLTPKALQALELLLRNSGQVVSRQEMIEALWPNAYVEESNLTVTISMLRKALGENENGTRFVETVAKRGYRLVPAVKSNRNAGQPVDKNEFTSMEISRLTHDGHIMDVAISDDAELLGYTLIGAGEQSLWVQDLSSGKRWQLLAPDPALCWGMRFAHDRQSLFYITTQPNTTISELYRIPTSGGRSTKLIVNIDAAIALSPDGTRIAFVRSFPKGHRDTLVVANADGSAEREIAARQHPDKFSFCAASWSPNGELIALGASRYSDTEFAILGVPVKGSNPVELSQWQWKYMAAVAWKGNNLYFSAMAANSNSFQIWRLSCLGGQPQRITNDPNNYEQISVAEKSPTLVTMLADVHTNLWLAPVSTGPGVSVGTLARRITSGKTEGFAGLAAAANCIVYASTEHQQSDLWKVNAEGSDRTRLTHGGGFFPSVSRDCRTIAYVSAQGGTHHIWHMDGDGGNQKQLTNGGGEGFPSISKDGRWVVYTSLSKERNTLWKIATEDGKTAQLTRNSLAIKPVVSPDGQCVACAYRRDEADQWKIGVLPIEGGEPLQTFALPNPYNQIIRWTADGRALTFLAKHDGVHNVWKQPLDGSAPIKLTNFTEDLIYHYDWLNDERLIVSRGMKTRDIVLIRNFE